MKKAKKKLGMKVLYEPGDEEGIVDVDLVLVHGLNGDPLKTWTFEADGSCVVWPRDLLPKELPRTRVLSFGYRGGIYHNTSIASVRDNARSLLARLTYWRESRHPVGGRPIIFLAHCLGGLIVKQAMCFAAHESEYNTIASATKSILFFGTPHFGADEKQWLDLAKQLSIFVKAVPWEEPAALVSAVTRNSPDLAEISEDFCHVAPRYAITTFFETQKWPGTQECIVNKTSARMNVENELCIPVDADHITMVQFEDIDDVTFQDTCKRIRDAIPQSGISTTNTTVVQVEDTYEDTLSEACNGAQHAISESHIAATQIAAVQAEDIEESIFHGPPKGTRDATPKNGLATTDSSIVHVEDISHDRLQETCKDDRDAINESGIIVTPGSVAEESQAGKVRGSGRIYDMVPWFLRFLFAK